MWFLNYLAILAILFGISGIGFLWRRYEIVAAIGTIALVIVGLGALAVLLGRALD
jgi:hypothetical protein